MKFLEYMQDVTDEVLSADDGQAAIDSLVTAAESSGKGLSASVEEFTTATSTSSSCVQGVHRRRLVGAPPPSIGKFGGDTGQLDVAEAYRDFSIFRIYAGQDNEPAEYSEDNVPYRPKKYFQDIHRRRGRRRLHLHLRIPRKHAGICDFRRGAPHRRDFRSRQDRPAHHEAGDNEKYMDSSQDLRIRYSSKYASVSNAWKKVAGEAGGIEERHRVAKEAHRAGWAAGTLRRLLDRLDSLYKVLEPLNFAREYTYETALAVELPGFATAYCNAAGGRRGELASDFYRDWWLPLEGVLRRRDAYAECSRVPARIFPIPPWYATAASRRGRKPSSAGVFRRENSRMRRTIRHTLSARRSRTTTQCAAA